MLKYLNWRNERPRVNLFLNAFILNTNCTCLYWSNIHIHKLAHTHTFAHIPLPSEGRGSILSWDEDYKRFIALKSSDIIVIASERARKRASEKWEPQSEWHVVNKHNNFLSLFFSLSNVCYYTMIFIRHASCCCCRCYAMLSVTLSES